MIIYYGVNNLIKIDVTDICMKKMKIGDTIFIPNNDHNRVLYFTDPLYGVHKFIIIENDGNIIEYDENYSLEINIITCEIISTNINQKLNMIHNSLILNHGNFYDELPEQKMAVNFLKGHEKVLEIGGNIGRNSLIISKLLNDSKNLVTLESDIDIGKQLEENKKINNLNFNIECSALSNRKLIQKGWETIPSDELLPGFNWVNTITLKQLKNKYDINFDTLVIDCEGAFYYILMDMPEILNNIQLIIMENDYHDINHKHYVDEILKNNNFIKCYVEAGGWGPCYNNFFEAWKR